MKGRGHYTIYKNGTYYNLDDAEFQRLKQNKRRKLAKRLLVAAACLIGLAILIKCTVYTDQYYWSNELVWAIQKQDEKKVEELLQEENMDVNRSGGVEFPASMIPLDEFLGSIPLEEACWEGNYSIAKKLIDYGADPGEDKSLPHALAEYHKNDSKLVKLLLANGANADQKIQDNIPLPVWVAEAWEPELAAELNNTSKSAVERETVEIYKMLLNYSKNKSGRTELLERSLKGARESSNQKLVRFLNAELEKNHNN